MCVTFSGAEMQQIQSAAEREAMAGAAWLGMVGVRAVAGEPTVAAVAEPAGGRLGCTR